MRNLDLSNLGSALAAVGGVLRAANISGKGLAMIIDLPKSRALPV